jgi:hypothetical protein
MTSMRSSEKFVQEEFFDSATRTGLCSGSEKWRLKARKSFSREKFVFSS